MSHTPGPWQINTAGIAAHGGKVEITEIYVYNPGIVDDVAIAADIIDPVTCKPSEANARLIVSAPDLLEALIAAEKKLCIAEQLLDLGEDDSITFESEILNARAAIAKATGQ